MINQISVLNSRHILQEMEEPTRICQLSDLKSRRQVTLCFLIHCCCRVERIVISRKPLQMALNSPLDLDVNAMSIIKQAFLPIEEAYAIRLSDAEFIYIYELLYC